MARVFRLHFVLLQHDLHRPPRHLHVHILVLHEHEGRPVLRLLLREGAVSVGEVDEALQAAELVLPDQPVHIGEHRAEVRAAQAPDGQALQAGLEIVSVGDLHGLLDPRVALDDVDVHFGEKALRAHEDIVRLVEEFRNQFAACGTGSVDGDDEFPDAFDLFVFQRLDQRHAAEELQAVGIVYVVELVVVDLHHLAEGGELLQEIRKRCRSEALYRSRIEQCTPDTVSYADCYLLDVAWNLWPSLLGICFVSRRLDTDARHGCISAIVWLFCFGSAIDGMGFVLFTFWVKGRRMHNFRHVPDCAKHVKRDSISYRVA